MKIFFILLTLISFNLYASSPRLIHVDGVCKIKAEPDLFNIIVTLKFEDKKQDVAFKALNKKNDELLKKVTKLKLTNNKLTTLQYSLQPINVWEKNKQVFKGYEAIAKIDIEFTEKENLGKLYSAISSLGITQTQGPFFHFSPSKSSELQTSCIELAVKDAQDKANQIAKNLKVRVKGVHQVNESSNPVFPRPGQPELMVATKSAPQVEVGESEYSKTLNISFLIE